MDMQCIHGHTHTHMLSHMHTHTHVLSHTHAYSYRMNSVKIIVSRNNALPEQRKTVVNSGVRLEYEKRLSFPKAVSREAAGFCVGSKGVCIVPQCVQGQAVPLSTVT